MRNKNILAVRNLIGCLDMESLRNPEVVANLVRAFGIVKRQPPFGEDEIFKNNTPSEGGIYQVPDQIAEALVYLSKFNIDSYLEVGIFHGGNFLFVSDYLSRFNPNIKCIGIDLIKEYLNDEIDSVIKSEDRYEFHRETSFNFIGKRFALVFIDGNHALRWVRKDWENVGQYADICMFHDIDEPRCKGPVYFWKELKKSFPDRKAVEFISKEPLCGIGVIHNG